MSAANREEFDLGAERTAAAEEIANEDAALRAEHMKQFEETMNGIGSLKALKAWLIEREAERIGHRV